MASALALLAVLGAAVPGCDRLRRRAPARNEALPAGADPSRRTGGSGDADPRLYHETRPYMGTLFRITVGLRGDPKSEAGKKALAESRRFAAEAVGAAFREVVRVENLFSTYIADTPVSRINKAAETAPTQPVKVPQEVFNLVHESLQLSTRSEGAFDVTFGPLGKLWAPPAEGKPPRIPTTAEIRQTQTRVGSRLVELDYDKTTVRLTRQGMSVGFGAIAKGYAVDQVVALLRARKLNDFIVDGGGDLFVAGRHPEREWRVGIKDPRRPDSYFATFAIKDRAVVTSGDYERFFLHEGRRYHHILDPRTGMPARGLSSVTVIHPKATLADALATAAFVLGPRKGYDFLSAYADVEFLMVSVKGNVLMSPGLREKVKMRPPTVGP